MSETDQSSSEGSGGKVPPPSDEDLLTVEEVAAMWRSSRFAVHRHIKAGRLRAVRQGRFIRIPRPAVREFTDTYSSPSKAAQS